jgi:hypothetical protein
MEAEISNYSEEQAEAYYASMKERWDRFAIGLIQFSNHNCNGRIDHG